MATDNLRLGRAWDDDFNGWTDELLLGRKVKKPRRAPSTTSSWTGAPISATAVSTYSGKGSKADVRARLFALARGGHQVVVKITGSSKSVRAIRVHLDYLARNGDQLIDQDGNQIKDEPALARLVRAWEHTGPQLDESADRKETFHLQFSMPEGTDARALYDAVKATAAIEFAGHLWVMVQHFDRPHVHAHVDVKAEALDGRRLNPRKADLQRWRERFAHELRERGVEAEATLRAPRMRQQKLNKPWAASRLEERGEATHAKPAVEAARAHHWDQIFDQVATTRGRIADALARSPEAIDRSLAAELRKVTAEQVRSHAQVIPERVRERER